MRKVLFIEILADGPPEERDPCTSDFLNSVGGPLRTLFHVRTTSQRERNALELQVLGKLCAATKISFQKCTFRLSGDQPLSWHLSTSERLAIEAHWPEPSRRSAPADTRLETAQLANAAELRALTEFLTLGGTGATVGWAP